MNETMIDTPINEVVTPLLSVVIVTPDGYSPVRRTIASLRAQTIAGSLELVIVAPSSAALQLDPDDVAVFGAVEVVEVGLISSVGAAYAAGVRRASAPLLALSETHAFPEKTWAQALVEAHRAPFAAVGPCMLNANPVTPTSCASFLIGYSRWGESTPRGIVDDLPGHNSSYKMSALRAYDDALESMMNSPTLLHRELRARGEQLFLESAARTSHLNESLLASFLLGQFRNGRVFGTTRTARWDLLRRIAYAASAPLILAIRFVRTLRQAKEMKSLQSGLLFVATLGLAAATAGEAVGALFGCGDDAARLLDMEFHRERHLARQDRAFA